MSMNMRLAVKALILRGNRILLLQRVKKDENAKIEWDIPGGGIEVGESFEGALKREIFEETKLSVKIRKPLRAWNCIDDKCHLYGVTFVVNYIEGEVCLSDEHEKFEWVNIDAITKMDVANWIKDEVAILKEIISG